MFDLGDELTVETYGIPWLIIWIQILIFFLLIILLCCFSVFTSDPSHYDTKAISSSNTSSSSSPAASYLNKSLLDHGSTTTRANRLQHNQIGESQSIKGEIATGTSTRMVTEENTEREGILTNSIVNLHPCNYFRLAKLALLKCFGLDPSSDSSPSCDWKKDT
ncbi:uncharacterized protein LOC110608179 [Manihot esculenta]|uniref:Uncharacterized protein n=2 Tax=Manihot esculenta TaxID=3983 RepID=A0ACB7GN07_MANES|nr:uncharacterized protein LOC110608179 [Manihot esculenta]KAG8640878.1 hypothetical protein MANES_13G077680v8 [Manihot esculenta]